MDDITEGKIARLRNLRHYADKTDDEIREMISQKKTETVKPPNDDKKYEHRFQEKLKILQSEHGLDMNDSNDKEAVMNLVRQLLQSENVDMDIRYIQEKREKNKDDVSTLKALGDFQRDIQMTISDLQDKLGISRKVRKEKSVDDIPQFIDSLLVKAKNFWERETVAVDCPKCNIELVRYWLNFPAKTTLVSFTTQCPQCEETVTYNA